MLSRVEILRRQVVIGIGTGIWENEVNLWTAKLKHEENPMSLFIQETLLKKRKMIKFDKHEDTLVQFSFSSKLNFFF